MLGNQPQEPSTTKTRRKTKQTTRNTLVNYLRSHPKSCAHVIAGYVHLSKSNCVEQLRKMILAGQVRRELEVNPLNGLQTYFYYLIE